MKHYLTAAVLAATVIGAVPASAQSIDFGPGGPSVDLRSRGQRERDFRREEWRRDRDYGDRRLYREQRFRDDYRRRDRRDYPY
jgi:hypothetical protein